MAINTIFLHWMEIVGGLFVHMYQQYATMYTMHALS